jgi:hypothetical protein
VKHFSQFFPSSLPLTVFALILGRKNGKKNACFFRPFRRVPAGRLELYYARHPAKIIVLNQVKKTKTNLNVIGLELGIGGFMIVWVHLTGAFEPQTVQ